MPHHVICGYLRTGRNNGLVFTNIKGVSTPTVTRVWRFLLADERIDYASGQMENLFGAPPHWPFGLHLSPVFPQFAM